MTEKNSTKQEQEFGDFMEMLFYNSRKGNLLEEFEKIVKYLNDAYFQPVDINSKEKATGVPSSVFSALRGNSSLGCEGTTSRRSLLVDDPYDEDILPKLEEVYNVAKYIQREFEEIKSVEQTERHKSYNILNKMKVANILETINFMKNQVQEAETLATTQYQTFKENLRDSLLYNPYVNAGDHNTSGGGPTVSEYDHLGNIESLLNLKIRLGLEVKTLEFLASCESSYLYLRYFILCAIAQEVTIAEEIGKRSDPTKFKNFPLYIRLLCQEIENIPFNTHNITFALKDFVKTASLYYTNGITRGSIERMFYSHPHYLK